jgi:hypothetical protein
VGRSPSRNGGAHGPNAIACPFQPHIFGHLYDRVDLRARFERAERSAEDRLLALSFGMAEAREQNLAVEDDRRIGREHEVWKVGLWMTNSIAAPCARSVSWNATHCRSACSPNARPPLAQLPGFIQGLML